MAIVCAAKRLGATTEKVRSESHSNDGALPRKTASTTQESSRACRSLVPRHDARSELSFFKIRRTFARSPSVTGSEAYRRIGNPLEVIKNPVRWRAGS